MELSGYSNLFPRILLASLTKGHSRVTGWRCGASGEGTGNRKLAGGNHHDIGRSKVGIADVTASTGINLVSPAVLGAAGFSYPLERKGSREVRMYRNRPLLILEQRGLRPTNSGARYL
jgi:hypothetical protein